MWRWSRRGSKCVHQLAPLQKSPYIRERRWGIMREMAKNYSKLDCWEWWQKKENGYWVDMPGAFGNNWCGFVVQAFSLASTVWTRCSGLLPLLWCSHILRYSFSSSIVYCLVLKRGLQIRCLQTRALTIFRLKRIKEESDIALCSSFMNCAAFSHRARHLSIWTWAYEPLKSHVRFDIMYAS